MRKVETSLTFLKDGVFLYFLKNPQTSNYLDRSQCKSRQYPNLDYIKISIRLSVLKKSELVYFFSRSVVFQKNIFIKSILSIVLF
jgi:hypothetical protein